ncbi:MAG: PAS domain-containing sensor histidine kinase [Bacteroidetes bacterium]|nr:PAS domain-containing sensor histidine kinase [Bacteroidota bacterium]
MTSVVKIPETGLLDLETIFNNVTDLIFLLRIEGESKFIFESVNKSYLKVSNLKPSQILGKPLDEILPESTFRIVNKKYRRLITTKKPLSIEEIWAEYPKDPIIVETNYLPITDKNRKVTHILGSARDITDRKKKEKEILDIETSFKDIFDTVTEAIYLLDKEGKFIDVNVGAVKMYGYKKNDFTGKTPEFLSAPGRNDMDETLRMIARVYEGETRKFRWWGKRKNGEIFPKEVFLNKGFYKGQQIVIATARDITESEAYENKLREFAEELQNLNISKDKFFSIIAHDLRSPFNGLLGFSKVLYEEFDELSKDELREYIGYLHSSSQNVYKLIENLLQWSRLQSGRFEFQPIRLDLYEEVLKVINLFMSQAIEKKISIINGVHVNTFIHADQNMINSILQNLMSNSLKFTNPGGRVLIKTGTTKDGYNEISVTDTGIGISPENIDKLFKIDEHFSTVGTSNEEGSGLGLVLCKEMAEKNNGYMKIKSKKNEGTTITFAVPIQK